MLDQVKMFTLLFGVFFSFGRVGGQVRCGQRQAGTTVQEVPGNAVAGVLVALWVTHGASISLQGKSSLLLSMHKTAAMKQVQLNPNYPPSSCY